MLSWTQLLRMITRSPLFEKYMPCSVRLPNASLCSMIMSSTKPANTPQCQFGPKTPLRTWMCVLFNTASPALAAPRDRSPSMVM